MYLGTAQLTGNFVPGPLRKVTFDLVTQTGSAALAAVGCKLMTEATRTIKMMGPNFIESIYQRAMLTSSGAEPGFRNQTSVWKIPENNFNCPGVYFHPNRQQRASRRSLEAKHLASIPLPEAQFGPEVQYKNRRLVPGRACPCHK